LILWELNKCTKAHKIERKVMKKSSSGKKGGSTVNVQFDLAANETLKLLKEKYGVRSMSDAFMKHVEDSDPDLVKIARRRVAEIEAIKVKGQEEEE
jgi:hypothetical protein